MEEKTEATFILLSITKTKKSIIIELLKIKIKNEENTITPFYQSFY